MENQSNFMRYNRKVGKQLLQCELNVTILRYYQEMESYLAPHPMKAKLLGKAVFMLPIVLFVDDTSSNRS